MLGILKHQYGQNNQTWYNIFKGQLGLAQRTWRNILRAIQGWLKELNSM